MVNVCFFLYLEFIVPLENFSLIWWRHHCRWRAANFDLCSALMAIEQWGFLNVPQLLWHGPTLYNLTLTPVVERLAKKLSLPVLRLRSVATAYWTPISRMRDEHSTSSPSRRLMTKFIIIRLKVDLIYSFHCGRMQEGY